MGEVFAQNLNKPDLIICSPSERTTETIELIMGKTAYEKELLQFDGELYLADTRNILYILSQLDQQYRHVFLVAHNPGITDCLNQLTGELIDKVPTCGIAQIQLHIDSWQEITPNCGRLTFYDKPKNHK